MTALPLGLRPRGLTWSLLRLHRPAVWAWAAFVMLLILGLTGLQMFGEHVERVNVSCGGAGMPVCDAAFHEASFEAVIRYTTWSGLASGLLAYLPLAVAAWAGGALVAWEMENGTAALAWAQSVSPARWLASRLAVPALLLVLGTLTLTALFRWSWVSGPPSLQTDWFLDDVYRATGPVGPASVLLALAAGVAAGVLTRRTLPALGLSFGITGLVQLLGTFYRDELRPDSHYWPLQLVETGIVLALTAALAATAFWLLRRRLP